MANGHHAAALRLVEPDDHIEIEQELGTAMEHAVMELCAGVNDYQTTGTLSPAFRATGGQALARVCRLQLDHGGGDTAFGVLARRAALRNLRHRFDPGLLERLSPMEADLGVLFWVDHVLAISSKVVADERARAH
jgi:hypothetical protein